MYYGVGVIFLRGKCGKSEMLGEEGKRHKARSVVFWIIQNGHH